ncbi:MULTISPECIES: hypothetical protein [unclassified Sinorhizobium]|uniref:hypothetical protein n=1 Tax=unclassified Sinorhizobium TaxID=2613772 RepID=UPI0024C2297A|nr:MULTISPECIES: hypothetical protein [unclassified Sinorhizobium]MDK1377286.1 hypothetical protein [Sinorhizobium sp. 6-70]MDK1481897.1 hypothetical protein [Sinorhizobium sp. 6-117]
MDFFDFSSALIWLALGLSGPAFLTAFGGRPDNWKTAAETTVGTTVFVGALGLYLSAGAILAAAIACLAALAVAARFRGKRQQLPMLAASILCLGFYV